MIEFKVGDKVILDNDFMIGVMQAIEEDEGHEPQIGEVWVVTDIVGGKLHLTLEDPVYDLEIGPVSPASVIQRLTVSGDEEPSMWPPIFVVVQPSGLVTVAPLGMHALMLALRSDCYAERARALMSTCSSDPLKGSMTQTLIMEVIFSLGLGLLKREADGGADGQGS